MRVSSAFRLETPKRRSHILAGFEVLIVFGQTDTPGSSNPTVRCLNDRNVSLNYQIGTARICLTLW